MWDEITQGFLSILTHWKCNQISEAMLKFDGRVAQWNEEDCKEGLYEVLELFQREQAAIKVTI